MPDASPSSPDTLDALQPGARVGEFVVERVLGAGGFGIVYLAVDEVLLRHVAVKEYLPRLLAGRGADGRVTLSAPGNRETFDAGLRSFLNEAQLLARFDHPSLVKVHRFWESAGTAYMSMPYYDGHVASPPRFKQQGPVDERRLRAFLDPLLDALALLHRDGVYHRDISPDNILLLPDDRPVLLDFGAARQVIGDRTQTLTAVLKPSFAPVEQYGDVPGMRQGPWTDLYALGAVAHHLLTGDMPPPAAVRGVRDAMPVLAATPSRWPGVHPASLAAIDWMLAVSPEHRPQSVRELRDALDGIVVPPPPTVRVVPVSPEPVPPAGPWQTTVQLPSPAPLPAVLPPAAPRGPRWRTPVVAAFAVAVLAGWQWARGPAEPAEAAVPVAATATTRAATTDPSSPLQPVAAPAPAVVVPAGTRVGGLAASDPVERRTPVPAAAPLPSSPKPVARTARTADSPAALCADRNAVGRAFCEARACLTDRYRAHPQCKPRHGNGDSAASYGYQ